jgi:predicted nucleic acid-binding protein
LERPYDDQDQDRIRLEAESILIVMRLVGSGAITWVGIDVLICESRRIRDPESRTHRDEILRLLDEVVLLDEERDIQRQAELRAMGFGMYDAGHLAAAEKAGCAVLLTTDDQLLNLSRKVKSRLRVRVENPAEWVREVLYAS